MEFIGNEIIKGNAVKNYVGGAAMLGAAIDTIGAGPTANSTAWRWQFNGGSVGCITATAGPPFETIPSTAWLTFRKNVVHSSGGIFVGSSHESTSTGPPSLGRDFVVEGNAVRDSPVCILINKNFTRVSNRGNICP